MGTRDMACLVGVLCLSLSLSAYTQQRCLPEHSLSTASNSRYRVSDGGAVTDLKTNLVWRACLEGQVGDSCSGEALKLNWAAALIYPHDINKSEQTGRQWRLPNIRELNTLVELRCFHPAINSEVFKGISSQQVWTSSPYQFYTHYSWYVDFNSGAATYDERVKEKSLLLVRPLIDN